MKHNNILSIISAFLGGMLGTLPWMICYIYNEPMYTILTLLIAILAFMGYKLFKGKINSKTIILITIITTICITITNFIIIPNASLYKKLGTISWNNYLLLIKNKKVLTSLINDYVTSLLFNLLGIGIVINLIKNQSKEDGKMKSNVKKNKKVIKDKEVKRIRNTIIGLAIVIIVSILIILGIMSRNNKQIEYLPKDVTFTIPNSYKEYKSEEEVNSWYYIPKKDLSGSSGVIEVLVYKGDNFLKDFNETKKSFSEALEGYSILNTDDYKNSNNYQVLKYVVDFDEYIEYLFYVFREDEYAVIIGYDYSKMKNNDIEKTTIEMANSFKWNK